MSSQSIDSENESLDVVPREHLREDSEDGGLVVDYQDSTHSRIMTRIHTVPWLPGQELSGEMPGSVVRLIASAGEALGADPRISVIGLCRHIGLRIDNRGELELGAGLVATMSDMGLMTRAAATLRVSFPAMRLWS